jgi:hypothetical protein
MNSAGIRKTPHGTARALFTRTFTERTPQSRDGLIGIVFLDDDIRPDPLDALALSQELSRPLDEIERGVEHSQRHHYLKLYCYSIMASWCNQMTRKLVSGS